MNYLQGRDQAEYSNHSHRQHDKKATKGERNYSEFWLKGFHSVWDNNGVNVGVCKNDFELIAFVRGKLFAKAVLAK